MKMRTFILIPALALGLILAAAPAMAITSFCPPGCTEVTDADGDNIMDLSGDPCLCMHVAAGDGLTKMADGYLQYVFGFTDVTGVPDSIVMSYAALRANQPSPTIRLREGQELYLNLSNYGMMIRPDLFDPHTVHWHGFPNASTFFDGVPDLSVAVNMGGTFTYYYIAPDPGTYIWHCHVEATEHIEMGMIAQLYVYPLQDGATIDDPTDGVAKDFTTFVYNDGNGTTGYDVEKAIQLTSFDRDFHDASYNVQPLNFAEIDGDYYMMNGRGYPDTVSDLPVLNENGYESQNLDAKVVATQGERVLLRLSNLSVKDFFTVQMLGMPMKVIGRDAKILRGGSDPAGLDMYYNTSSVTIGGGQTIDVLVDTTGVTPGTYYLICRNLYSLNNFEERRGGMMTEFEVLP